MSIYFFFFFLGGCGGSFVVAGACVVCMDVYGVCWAEARISLLTDFEDATSYLDWTIGTHGIQITFSPPPTSPSASDAPSPLSSAVSLLSRPLMGSTSGSNSSNIGRTLSATYLPEVAPEQGWDHIDALDSAIRKAGWSGRISEDLRRRVRVRRYQSRKCVVGWEDFVAWRADRGSPVDLDLVEGGLLD